MLWLLERDIYGVGPHPLEGAIAAAGQRSRVWSDDAWESDTQLDGPVVFHGSLGNAARIAASGRWAPGAYCNTAAFHCSRWYPAAKPWLLHREYVLTTVAELSADPIATAGSLADASGQVFVRPDSPLKPFSGRVVQLEGLTPGHLDHGFYYERLDLPIVVSRKRSLGDEWRFVICQRSVITGCRYEAEGRVAGTTTVDPRAAAVADQIAAKFVGPDPVYVLDLVESEHGIEMVEINPFSGADLYACDKPAIVQRVAETATAS
ncbi:hypothetical protein DB30_03569 [Enhygromyxa salina]|uniref:ATP-grasp domain-containing protein n=1 Tax=Enhygromyxa salina TaxID=215803 RepID=A0A0C2D201_9BACT|nr:ATP-grasp domain-containing protein [Enhygromyxa salina]KIG17256.1 hypothetical protein DB30_03569 [Enhygromyxa salina]